MTTVASVLTAIVAIEHFYILWIEMFSWENKGKKTFKGSLLDELFKQPKNWLQIKDFITDFWQLD